MSVGSWSPNPPHNPPIRAMVGSNRRLFASKTKIVLYTFYDIVQSIYQCFILECYTIWFVHSWSIPQWHMRVLRHGGNRRGWDEIYISISIVYWKYIYSVLWSESLPDSAAPSFGFSAALVAAPSGIVPAPCSLVCPDRVKCYGLRRLGTECYLTFSCLYSHFCTIIYELQAAGL